MNKTMYEQVWEGFVIGPLWQPGQRGRVNIEVRLAEPPMPTPALLLVLRRQAGDLSNVDGFVLRRVEERSLEERDASASAAPSSDSIEARWRTATFRAIVERRWAVAGRWDELEECGACPS